MPIHFTILWIFFDRKKIICLFLNFIKNAKDTAMAFCKKFEVPFNRVYFFIDPSSSEAKLQANKLFDLTMHNAKNNRDAGIDYLNQILVW